MKIISKGGDLCSNPYEHELGSLPCCMGLKPDMEKVKRIIQARKYKEQQIRNK